MCNCTDCTSTDTLDTQDPGPLGKSGKPLFPLCSDSGLGELSQIRSFSGQQKVNQTEPCYSHPEQRHTLWGQGRHRHDRWQQAVLSECYAPAILGFCTGPCWFLAASWTQGRDLQQYKTMISTYNFLLKNLLNPQTSRLIDDPQFFCRWFLFIDLCLWHASFCTSCAFCTIQFVRRVGFFSSKMKKSHEFWSLIR